MLRVIAVVVGLLGFTSSVAMGAEWGPWPAPKDGSFAAAGFKHDDGGALVIVCNTRARLISILIEEPRARWNKGATMSVTVRSDNGTELKPSTGVVTGPTQLIVQEQATWDLWIMGKANKFFATGVGGYARIFPTANFKPITAPVLAACGDRW